MSYIVYNDRRYYCSPLADGSALGTSYAYDHVGWGYDDAGRRTNTAIYKHGKSGRLYGRDHYGASCALLAHETVEVPVPQIHKHKEAS